MPYTPDLATRLYEEITENIRLQEELKEKIFKQIRENNQPGGAQTPLSDMESTLSKMEILSAKIQADYNRLEFETSWAPEVA